MVKQPPRFLRLNWSEANYLRLKTLLGEMPAGSWAVFDWDNTCIFNDCGDAFFRHQLFHLDFHLSPSSFAALLPDEVNGVSRVHVAGEMQSLAELKDIIAADYAELVNRRASGPAWRDCLAYRRFAAAMLALNSALERDPAIGCRFAYAWVIGLLAGFTPAEVGARARRVWSRALRRPIARLACGDGAGQVTYHEGLRVYPEMRNLMRALRGRGARVAVITATSPHIVAAIAAAAGYPVDAVIGMQSRLEAGVLQPERDDALAVNYGAGKVANIRALLQAEPLLVAGDSDGDVEMLTAFAATRVRLIIDRRLAGSRIAALYARAATGRDGLGLQAIDDRRGRFVR